MYIVVENAGYEGERDVKNFISYRAALKWLLKNYAEDERDGLHVAIAFEDGNGRSYDL